MCRYGDVSFCIVPDLINEKENYNALIDFLKYTYNSTLRIVYIINLCYNKKNQIV